MLNKEVKTLKKELSKYKKPKKDSTNSSIPPSKDENRLAKKNQSTRKKSGKKTGGQKGHQGNTLQMTDCPDEVKTYKSNVCKYCKANLKDMPFQVTDKAQVVDIIMPSKHVVEHQNTVRLCTCGCKNYGTMPNDIPKGASYSNRFSAIIAYFMVKHYLPFKRTSEIFYDLFDIKISEGTLYNKLKGLYIKCLPFYQKIKQSIIKCFCLGSDETGFKINGKKYWAWVWQNNLWTYIAINKSRGFAAIEDEFSIDDLAQVIMVSDRWAAQLKTKTKDKQFCLAHLLREFIYLGQLHNLEWSKSFIEQILKIYEFKRTVKYYNTKKAIKLANEIKASISELLNQSIDEKYKEILTIQKKLKANINYITTCLDNKQVPPDNNWSERAIRNYKTKMKISGGFRSELGAKIYATIRSIIDTAEKQNEKVFDKLTQIAYLQG